MTRSNTLLPADRPAFRLLDKFDRGLGYADSLATISAGYMQGDRPVVSRDGTIYLHDAEGRAPHLKQVLAERKGKSLTIAFMHDHLDDIIKQRYAAYSRGSCLWSGDEESVMVFGDPVKIYKSGTPEYEQVMGHKDTKLHYSIYFYLAEWRENGAAMILADGFAPYRIRTTSRNSARNLVLEYNKIKDVWQGPFKGIPFELTLVNERLNGPDGKKRTFPVFKFTMRPRGGALILDSGNFYQLATSGNQAAAAFSLPAPKDPTPEDDAADAMFAGVDAKGAPETANSVTAEAVRDTSQAEHVSHNAPETDDVVDAEFEDIDPEKLKNLQQNKDPTPEDDAADAMFAGVDAKGAPETANSVTAEAVRDTSQAEHVSQNAPEADDVVDAEFEDIDPEKLKNLQQNKDPELMKRKWFAAVKGSHLDSAEGRAEFLARHIDGVTSLSQAVGALSTSNWAEVIIAAEDEIKERQKEDESQAKLAAPQGWHPTVTPQHAKALVDVVRYLGLKRVEVYPFISMVIGKHVHGRGEVTGASIVTVLKATGTVNGELEWNYSESKAADLLMDFETWQVNEGVEGVL